MRHARHGQRIARKAILLPRQRRAEAGVELARAEHDDVERILRFQIKAADMAHIPRIVHAQHIGRGAVEQHDNEQKDDGAQGAFFELLSLIHI